jgi:tripartite-type tricarboxylate transporter receptor subunit TctC
MWIAGLAAPAFAAEPAWPSRPLKILVPGAAGGVTDLRARWLAARLSPLLGQPIVIENRPGGAGTIATEAGARSGADGYTLLMVHQGTIAVLPHLQANVAYDPLKDFAAVTRVGAGSLVLVVPSASPARTLKELVALGRERSGLHFGSPGVGTPPHLAAELLKAASGLQAMHVPYQRGGGQTHSDLIGGHVDFMIEGMTAMLPHIQAGRVRALAVTGARRARSLPDVPTMEEAGVPGYAYEGWVGIVAPARTPNAIVSRLYDAIAQVLSTPEALDWFALAGAVPAAEPPAGFAAIMREEHAKWGKLIRETGMKAE